MQYTSYFSGYYSTSDLNLEANGSVWPLNNFDNILNNGHYCNGAMSSPFTDLHLGYNKEALKQTMLKHEVIFKDQIHELHRLHRRQKELMEEMKRAELCKHQLQLETLQSSSVLSQNSFEHVLKTCHATSLTWVNPSSSWSCISDSKSSLVPLSFADGKSTLAGHDLVQNEASTKDSEFLITECKKFGKKILDLELPAYEYVDSEEESLEAEKVLEVCPMPINHLNRTFEVVDKCDKELSLGSIGFNSDFQQNNLHPSCISLKAKCLVDLNEPIKHEEKADSESNDFMGPVTGQKDIKCPSLSGKIDSCFHVLSDGIIENAQTRDDLGACSYVLHREKNEVQKEWVSDDDETGKSRIDLNSSPLSSCAEKTSKFEHIVFKQAHELPTPPVVNQSNRKSCNEGLQNLGRDHSSSSHTGPAAASYMQTSYQLVHHTDVGNSESSWVSSLRKRDLKRAPIAVQALPCFNTSVSLSKRLKSSISSTGLAGDSFLHNKNLTSSAKVDKAGFLQVRFCNSSQSDSKTLEGHQPAINFGCLNCSTDNDSASQHHSSTKHTKVSLDASSVREVNLDPMPRGCSSNVTLSQNNIDGEKKLEDSTRRLHSLGGKTVRKPDERSELVSVCMPCVSNCQCLSHASPAKTNQNLSEDKHCQNNEKAGLLDINLDCNPLPDSEERLTASELVAEKGLHKEFSGFKVCIDLNSCVNGDGSLLTPSLSTELNLEAPVSPENKESNRPRGESDGNQASPENRDSSSPSGESDENHASSVNNERSPPRREYDGNQTPVGKENPPPWEESGENLSTPEKESSPPREESYENQSSVVKESSPPRGEFDENQLERPCLSSEQEYTHLEEEPVRIAAEAIISISSSGIKTCVESSIRKPTRAFLSGYLHWFARVASSVVDDSESEFGLVLSGKDKGGGNQEGYLPYGMDYFEAMTLELTEMKVEEYWCKSSGPKPEVTVATLLPSKPRSGRTRRGRLQRKDFQSEILPSLASLSRCEVTEDLQTIGGLMEAAGTHWETSSLRNAGRNRLARGRKRSCVSASRVIESMVRSLQKQQSSSTEVHVEERKLIDWGKITRRRRGPRCPASNPRLILGQV